MNNNINHKGINKAIASLLGEEQVYDLRREFRTIACELTYQEAMDELDRVPEEDKFLYSITSTIPDDYACDINLALYAAKRVAERNQQTFVLSLEDGVWKAAYGDWGNCSEHIGSNPALVTCMAVLKFHGKL